MTPRAPLPLCCCIPPSPLPYVERGHDTPKKKSAALSVYRLFKDPSPLSDPSLPWGGWCVWPGGGDAIQFALPPSSPPVRLEACKRCALPPSL